MYKIDYRGFQCTCCILQVLIVTGVYWRCSEWLYLVGADVYVAGAVADHVVEV